MYYLYVLVIHVWTSNMQQWCVLIVCISCMYYLDVLVICPSCMYQFNALVVCTSCMYYIYELQIYFYCDTIQINVVFLVMALVQLYRTQKGTESRGSSNTASIKATMKAAILLLPLMGMTWLFGFVSLDYGCLLYTSPSPRDRQKSRMPSSA